jgi:ribosomal protein S18
MKANGKRSSDRNQRSQARPARRGKPKVCVFCASRVDWVDYKDVNTLRRLMSEKGKIKARRVTGTCRQHQRDVAIAIKTARELALLPYALLPTSSDKSRHGGGRRESRAPVVAPQRDDEANDDDTPTTAANGALAASEPAL